MTMPASFSRRQALACVAVLCLAGCTRPEPPKSSFLLQPPPPPPPSAGAWPVTLKVDAVTVASPFAGRSLVYRESELKYEADFYDEFLVPPAAMIGEAIAGWLAAAGLYRAVLAPSSALDGDLSLDAFVSELYTDLRVEAKPVAIVSIDFYLAAAGAAPGAFLWSGELSGRREVDSRSAAALAGGLSAAFGEVLEELAAALRAHKPVSAG